jgi:hypothetical protein
VRIYLRLQLFLEADVPAIIAASGALCVAARE